MSEAIAERRPLPTGTVTFLFSDIEGSTQRWESHRDAMKAAVRKHDELMHAAIAAHNGHVFKTVGDAFCAAFSSVPDAIGVALDAQRAIKNEDFSAVDGLKVRMAVHTGLADERSGDYFGPTVNRVARLLSIGHGGQVLVSGVSTELCQGMMPAQATLRDLGAHRLRDLTHPEQVYQLVAPGLDVDFPALRSLEALPNNLPLQLTNLVGRENDVAEIEDLLIKHRLVTLVGAGGVGKTRLSLQVGAELLDKFEDGVWFVDLAPISDPALVPSTLAGVFNIGETGGRPVADSVIQALKPKRLLIILDNCEHLVAGAAKIADAVLRGCPHVRILASSREGLGIEGEVVLRVPSLAVPPAQAKLSALDAKGYGAIALFVERASAADRRFKLTDDNATTVARICEQLDGIALAIELASTRVKVLSVEQLASRLADRFRILTSGSRTALPRQQTMRALIDWSYDLLSDNEKTLFRRVSVFAGGWTLDAAGTVCADVKIDPLDVLDLLSALVDKSMVVSELLGSEQRYRLLASTRQYATELLETSGEADIVRRRHAEFFAAAAKRADEEWSTTPTVVWFARLLPDIDNFRAALDWAITERRDVELGAALAAPLALFWSRGPQPEEGRRRVLAAMAANAESPRPELEAPLQLGVAILECQAWRYEAAIAAARRARELFEQLGDRTGAARASWILAEPLIRQRNHEEAEHVLDGALEFFHKIGDARMIAFITTQKGRSIHFQGDHAGGRKLYEEALPYLRSTGATDSINSIINNLAEVEFAEGNAERALTLARDLLPKLSAWDRVGRALTQANIAAYLIALGRFDEAREMARDALEDARPAGPVTYAESIQHLAAIAAAKQNPELAARLLGFCERTYSREGTRIDYTEQQEYDKLTHSLRTQLNEAELSRLKAEGATLNEDQVYEEALKV